MRSVHTIVIVVSITAFAAGCAIVERARMYGAEAAGRAVGLECALSLAERQNNLDAVNGWLLAQSSTARAVALDCDGDGNSDF